jgi:hypothetical protein
MIKAMTERMLAGDPQLRPNYALGSAAAGLRRAPSAGAAVRALGRREQLRRARRADVAGARW